MYKFIHTTSYAADINLILAAAFYFNLRRPQKELFFTSLYKTNHIIKDRETAKEIK